MKCFTLYNKFINAAIRNIPIFMIAAILSGYTAVSVASASDGIAAADEHEAVKLFAASNKGITEVDRVTVFADRALVERKGSVSVPEGESRIIIRYLTQRIDKNSVRVSVSGGASAKLGGVEVFFDRFTPESVQELKDSIQSIDDRLAELKIEEDGVATRKSFLQSVAKLGGAEPQGEYLIISAENLTTTADFLETQLEKIAKTKTKIAVERRELNKRKSEFKEKLNQITGGNAGRGYRIEVPIETKSAARFNVEVRYVVHGAGWQPQYDARYNYETEKVLLSYFGQITQSTGEDWAESKIVLSTAQPQLGTEPPKLNQWLLRKYTPRPAGRGGAQKAARAAMIELASAEDEFAGDKEYEIDASYITAAPSISGETVIFQVPGRRTIPTDGQSHRVVIAELEFDTQRKFVTVPKLDQRVYLTAKCKNESDYLLLPGKVSVFQGNDYIGTQYFDEPLAFDEEFSLAMGPVQTIKVERKRTKEFAERTGIIGQNKREFFTFEIELANNSKSEAEIEVIDHIPHSADEDIKVEDVMLMPEPAEKDKKFDGQLIWRIPINPGEKKKIKIQFAVKYPKKITIEGI